jgi:putative mRNA 3-end processing factor
MKWVNTMLIMTKNGLYCPAGDFYIDPNGAVEHAVITHAHSDHARRGSKHYYCTNSSVGLLRVRLGQHINVIPYPFGQAFQFQQVKISFHPAGHILGSAQIRIELFGEVWVVSGDYKREIDPTCEAFTPLPCDVFITEATFGTPAYQFKKTENFGSDIANWWRANSKRGKNSILFAYSLGKAQRILALVAPYITATIYCHPATEAINQCYLANGVKLAATTCLSTLDKNQILENAFFLVPPSFFKSPYAGIAGARYQTAFASG